MMSCGTPVFGTQVAFCLSAQFWMTLKQPKPKFWRSTMFQLSRSFDPFRELDDFANEVNRFTFADGTPFRRFRMESVPAINVWQDDNGVVVKADLPGMNAESLDVSVEGEVLTVGGSYEDDSTADENATIHRRERATGAFNRTIRLPYEVDAGTADATYTNGVLTIKLSRPEEQRPKKITVQAV
jgi:HSP20 family protein